jgi:Flp pilus assembly pilin Flp
VHALAAPTGKEELGHATVIRGNDASSISAGAGGARSASALATATPGGDHPEARHLSDALCQNEWIEENRTVRLIKRFFVEKTGAETVEYALVLALMALAAVDGVSTAGTKLGAGWNSLSTTINGLSTST